MKRIVFALVAVAAVAGVVGYIGAAYGQATLEAAPIFVNEIPSGYRDWRLISVAHEEGNLNSFAAVLGSDQSLSRAEPSVPGRRNHCRFALQSHLVRGKQQGFWPISVFCCRRPHEYSVYGQGFEKVRHDGRLGIRSLQRRQTRRPGVHEYMLPLPQSGQSSRPYLHPLCTLILRITVYSSKRTSVVGARLSSAEDTRPKKGS